MNELGIYKYGQDILTTSCFPEYKNIKDYNIFFRGIFDKHGTIYDKTIFKSDLEIEIYFNNIDIYRSQYNQKYKAQVTLFNKSILEVIPTITNKIDAIFMSPPWGGVNYKESTNVTYYLDNKFIYEIIVIFYNYQISFL